MNQKNGKEGEGESAVQAEHTSQAKKKKMNSDQEKIR